MKGHIRKRGDAWELRVYVGVDAVTGKKRYATKSIRGGKRDAERALVELAADAQRGKLSRTNTTVAELLDAWFDQASQDFSPKTVVELGLHRAQPQASPRHGSVDSSQGCRSRPLLHTVAEERWPGRPAAFSGDDPTHSRHPASRTSPSGSLGMDRSEPGRIGEPATRQRTRDPAGRAADEVAELFRAVGDDRIRCLLDAVGDLRRAPAAK